VFEDSIADVLDRYIGERLRHALFAQALIGTFAGPRDPGTASIKLMHHQGDLLGLGSVWGYVEGGMGRTSFAIAQAALEAGAEFASRVPVARILPGEGVQVESGELIRAPTVICKADPKRMMAMLEGSDSLPDAYRERLRRWDTDSPAYDDSVVPPGREVMSVFAQFAPYELAEGDWDSRRDEIGALLLDEIAVYAPDVRDCVDEYQVLGPPDIERRIGLTGGHIFQGQALPGQMWDRRLEAVTPVEGLYLCGAATHPGGSVIGLNGRIAAMAVLGRTRSVVRTG
jgi:phytoene dehydrogenase-like protein